MGLNITMSRTRMAIIAFWVVIISLLLWECSNYDRHLTQQSIDHPQQQHFFFYRTNAAPAVAAPPARNGAWVEQTSYEVVPNSPGPGSFTCRVTLRNLGNAKAAAVQVNVRPYKGIALGDVDTGGHHKPGALSDTDATSMMGQWVTFPDLAVGASETRSAVFIMRRDVDPGTNPQPDILFETEKSKAGSEPMRLPPPSTLPPRRASPND